MKYPEKFWRNIQLIVLVYFGCSGFALPFLAGKKCLITQPLLGYAVLVGAGIASFLFVLMAFVMDEILDYYSKVSSIKGIVFDQAHGAAYYLKLLAYAMFVAGMGSIVGMLICFGRTGYYPFAAFTMGATTLIAARLYRYLRCRGNDKREIS